MHTADLLSSPFIYNVFKTAKSPFGMFSEAVKWLQKSRVSLAIMCTSRSEAQRQVMPKKKKRWWPQMGGCVWAHRGTRFIRHHDRDADNKTYSPMQKLGGI